MVVLRVLPDAETQAAILDVVAAAEEDIAAIIADFERNSRGMIPTERHVEQEMFA
jgi:hypothetical protein